MPSDPRDYKLDLQGVAPSAARTAGSARPFLSVLFACCNTYQRIYRDPGGTEYCGRCPRCGKPVRFAVGDGGTTARFFKVS